MISVIITVHEPLLKHLQRCVDSVLWQLAPEDELLIVGDRMPAGWKNGVPAVIALDQNREVISGASAARNLGLTRAQGEWVKFLDADDLLAPFALNAFRHAVGRIPPGVGVLAGSLVKVVNGLVRGYQDPPDIDAVITKVNPILPSMAFVRRKAAQGVDGFDERICFEEDWDFWLRLRARDWRFATCLIPFCYYWVDDAERVEKEKTRKHQVEGADVRTYLAKTYGIKPQ